MEYLQGYSSSDEETPDTPVTTSPSPTPEPEASRATSNLDARDDSPWPSPVHKHLPFAESWSPAPATRQSAGERQPAPLPRLIHPGTKLYQAWELLQSHGDFEDVPGVVYQCPLCDWSRPKPMAPRAYPDLLRHVARCHVEHHTCLFCGRYSSSRVDQLGRHRSGCEITPCPKVEELGGPTAYENLYKFLVDNGKDIEDKQLGNLKKHLLAMRAKYQHD
ncbi:hypothetical protein AURDEDRAFT_159691 [Auricularia subglabra TFB-10046 SS5]|nr:hypothetical protein AURDEDRAFT_159691 [Auricularia subglabra TFB-10046 SS5]